MKIYFAGSIRGGRQDRSLYLELINFLSKFGQVLTEHIGDQALEAWGEDGPTDEWIYERDMEWLRESDLIIAEVTTPSLGVGYELGQAESLGKPVLCLYREQAGKRLSAMVSGNANMHVEEYNTLDEAKSAIEQYMAAFESGK